MSERKEWALAEIEQTAKDLVMTDSDQAERLFKALEVLKEKE